MGHETAAISSNERSVFANAQSACLVVNDPDAHDGMIPVKFAGRRERLENKTLLAVVPAGRLRNLAAQMKAHVGALAAELGFSDKTRAGPRLGTRRQFCLREE